MMTRAFKIFILMLLVFASFWIYRFRARDIRYWLELGSPPPAQEDELAALRSKVDGAIDPSRASRILATIYFRKPIAEEPLEYQTLVDPPPEVAEAPEPIWMEPEEEPPVEIIFRERPVDPAKEKEKEKEKEREAEKAKAKKAPEKAGDPKKDSPKADRKKPEKARSSRLDPHAAPADGSRPSREPPPVVSDAEGSGRARARTVTHVVREKETLASLARRYYKNDTERWRAIFAANQDTILNPDDLPVGSVILIPDPILDRGSGDSRTKGERKASDKAAAARRERQVLRS